MTLWPYSGYRQRIVALPLEQLGQEIMSLRPVSILVAPTVAGKE